jgi:ArsR family transcriptional regulator
MESAAAIMGRTSRGRIDGAGRVALVLRAASDRTRLRLLQILRGGPICVGDLVTILRMPQPTVSRHLAHLRAAGLVVTRRHRFWTFYALARPASAFHGKLLACLDACSDEVPQIRADAVRVERLRATGGCCPDSVRLVRERGSR